MRFTLVALLCVWGRAAHAANPAEILAKNTRGIVYLEVTDASGHYLDSGTGLIVSHKGHVITAAHVSPKEGQTLWGVIGQRQGTRFILERREVDEASDVALWQLPQSASCRYSVTLSTASVDTASRLVAIGFPGTDGLSAATISVTNTNGENGTYLADGFLHGGYSGGPVFNEAGLVVATVQAGRPSGGNNRLMPIAAAIALINRRGVRAGIDAEAPFENSCFAFCRSPAHGIESWGVERSWQMDSGEVSGGHNRQDECNKLISASVAGSPGAQIELLPGEGNPSTGMWEENHKDFGGQVHYKYFCKGTFRSGPTYKNAQSPACGLWQ
jgi:hypothetical protein